MFEDGDGEEGCRSNGGASMQHEVVERSARMSASTTSINGPRTRRQRRRAPRTVNTRTIACAILATTFQTTMAQNCISLSNSKQCPAFSSASISTNDNLAGLFPFLSSVTDTASFDSGLKYYVDNDFAQLR
jgi:hypothetical protein